ncbi:hypothetical protein B5F53_14620 [Blautia sp. An249]|nr:hypothetical protein B5F53_14620 [Blautia sp. An249]
MIIPEETQAKSLAERGDEMKRKRKVPLAIKILLIILAPFWFSQPEFCTAMSFTRWAPLKK